MSHRAARASLACAVSGRPRTHSLLPMSGPKIYDAPRLQTEKSFFILYGRLCTDSYLPQRFWREGWIFNKTLQM